MNIKSKGTKLHPSFVFFFVFFFKCQDLTSSNRNSKSIRKARNQVTNKNAAAHSSRTKDISANELNIHFLTIAEKVITVNRTESNDLCAQKEFCDIKHIVCSSYSTHDNNRGLQRTYTCKANWNSRPRWSGWKILKLSAPVISDTLTYVYNL